MESRIKQITKSGVTTNTYAYNGFDARTTKTDSLGTNTFKRAGAGVTSPVLADSNATYTPGISEKRGGTSRYLHSGLKNADSQTLTDKTIAATRDYDAFGNVLTETPALGWKGPFGNAGGFGYQEDPDHGLKLLGHRYYDSSTGRFLSRDSAEDGRNWYIYCENNPTSATDTDGLEADWLIFVGEVAKRLNPYSPEGMHARLTSAHALASSVTFGIYDGGAFKDEPGFQGSEISWAIAELALTRGALAPSKLLLKGLFKRVGGKLFMKLWAKAGYLLGTSKNAADALGKAKGFAKLGIKGDNLLNRLQVLEWIMRAGKAKGILQANGRYLRKIRVKGPNGKEGTFHTVWDKDGNFLTGWIGVDK